MSRLAVLGGAVLLLASTASPALAQAWPETNWPGPLPSKRVAFPSYEVRTLPNGLPVLIVQQHEQPSVSFRLIVRAGALQEPADRSGVASLVSTLVNQGTTTRTAGQIANAVESAGGIFGVGSGDELSFVNGAIIKDQMDLMLAIAADIVQHPTFAPEEIERQRSQMLSALTVSYDDPDYLANLVFNRLVFGAHPYGRPKDGTPESIRRITRDDLVQFHRTWFVPNNAILAIVGDVTNDEGYAAALRAFGSWPRRDIPEVRATPPPPPTPRIVVIDRPGSAQTEIRVGSAAIPRTHADYLPLNLAVRILGGQGVNRLFGILRTMRGLTYGASAEMRAYRTAGEIVAETNTRTPTTGEALRLIVEECVRMQRDSVDPRELRGVQDFVSGNFPLSIESSGAIAEQVLGELFYGLDPKELDTYRERVDRVTAAEVQRVSRTFLRTDALAIVLVGDADRFVEQLKALGFPTFERIPASELDLSSPTLRRIVPDRR